MIEFHQSKLDRLVKKRGKLERLRAQADWQRELANRQAKRPVLVSAHVDVYIQPFPERGKERGPRSSKNALEEEEEEEETGSGMGSGAGGGVGGLHGLTLAERGRAGRAARRDDGWELRFMNASIELQSIDGHLMICEAKRQRRRTRNEPLGAAVGRESSMMPSRETTIGIARLTKGNLRGQLAAKTHAVTKQLAELDVVSQPRLACARVAAAECNASASIEALASSGGAGSSVVAIAPTTTPSRDPDSLIFRARDLMPDEDGLVSSSCPPVRYRLVFGHGRNAKQATRLVRRWRDELATSLNTNRGSLLPHGFPGVHRSLADARQPSSQPELGRFSLRRYNSSLSNITEDEAASAG